MRARIGDAAVVAGLLMLFALPALPRLFRADTREAYFLITRGGQPYMTCEADTDRTVTVETPRGNVTVRVENGSVRVTDADCPDGLCVHMPPLDAGSYDGASIICVPCGVCVTKYGADESGADIVAG